jgi:hypothetical protein
MRCLLSAVMLAASVAAVAAEPETQVFLAGGELNYVGPITDAGNKKAFALYEAEARKPPVLLIRSPGGVTSEGMALGRWVRQHQMTVKVLDLCFSSCANYVFPAAPRKIVSDFAVVGYHGGLSSDDFSFDAEQEAMFAAMPEAERAAMRAAMLKQIKESLAAQLQAEAAYFADIGVQQRITRLGQTKAYQDRYGKDEQMLGWYYSVDGFRKLGVDHITVINGPWKPQLTSAGAAGSKVFEVAVD